MPVTDAEKLNTDALIEETKETEKMAKKLHAILRRPGSIDRMKAIRVNLLGQPITEPPPPPKKDDRR